jgi:ABC-type sugar transport system ATPase subunit
MVFQHPALFPHLSVFDNLAFGLRARDGWRADVRDRVDWAAGQLGLTDVLRRRPATLSGGQRQRVALGRALVRRPSVFLFDEPLSALDGPLRSSVREDLADLHRRVRATMIYVTHDQAEALALGQRVAVFENGRLAQVGPPREVYERPADLFVAGFVGSPPMNLVEGKVESGPAGLLISIAGVTGPEALEAASGPLLDRLHATRGKPVTLGVRPEDLKVFARDGALPPPFSRLSNGAEVVRLEFLGNETIATLCLGPHRLSARLSGAAGISMGDVVGLGIDLSRASWFDPLTGRALEPGPFPIAETGRSG